MDLFGQIGEGLLLDLETGLHELLFIADLHFLLFPRGLLSANIVVLQHQQKEDAEEQQDDNHRQESRGHLRACKWHKRKA